MQSRYATLAATLVLGIAATALPSNPPCETFFGWETDSRGVMDYVLETVCGGGAPALEYVLDSWKSSGPAKIIHEVPLDHPDFPCHCCRWDGICVSQVQGHVFQVRANMFVRECVGDCVPMPCTGIPQLPIIPWQCQP